MGATEVTPMSRLLYAMLQQTSPKGINWNDVAKHPILSQEISNGHCARLRYYHFHKKMQNLRLQKPTPARVTKGKKDKVCRFCTCRGKSCNGGTPCLECIKLNSYCCYPQTGGTVDVYIPLRKQKKIG
ncbi:hypothetical protein B0H63DRAFT_467468, partial [Podospora didyma]